MRVTGRTATAWGSPLAGPMMRMMVAEADAPPPDPLAGLDAHELVELRALLASRVEAIDARLRELDGRNTAGAPRLYVCRRCKSAECSDRRHESDNDTEEASR